MQDLIDEAKELGISHLKYLTLEFSQYECSAKKIADKILEFIKENNVDDAYWETSSVEEYGETIIQCEVSILVNKTEEELKKEISDRKKSQDKLKEVRRAQYNVLKQEFGD